MNAKSIFIAVGLVLITHSAAGEDWGYFRGSLVTEWLADNRSMRLENDFTYVSPENVEWVAPADSVVDGASIPQFAWSIIGGPFEGAYRNASVIHDVACVDQNRPWEDVHLAFYKAMRASEVGRIKALVMYAAVYHVGPRWARQISKGGFTTFVQASTEAELIRSEAVTGSTSTVTISEKRPTRSNDPVTFDLDIRITPPAAGLSESEFENLRVLIESEESFGLADVEAYDR